MASEQKRAAARMAIGLPNGLIISLRGEGFAGTRRGQPGQVIVFCEHAIFGDPGSCIKLQRLFRSLADGTAKISIETLKEDAKAIFHAASQASKACDFILAFQSGSGAAIPAAEAAE